MISLAIGGMLSGCFYVREADYDYWNSGRSIVSDDNGHYDQAVSTKSLG
jgi:hypothetical protein